MNKFIGMSFVLALAFLVSIFSCSVYATEASSDTEVDLELAPVINITTPETSNINCASLNTLCTSTATVTVGTNNSTGYTLQLNATNGYFNSLTNAATSETIPTLAGAYAAGSFPTNYWGYTGGLDKSGETGGYNCAANYCPVLAYQSTESNYAPNHAIKATNAPSSDTTTITFGAKADTTKSSGTYSTSVTFTAVTNYAPRPITNGMNMQDIASDNCAATINVDTTYTVIDSRDNTNYTVAKLEDGNCWMTQNLELGSTAAAINLTNATSNVSSSGYSLTPADSTYKGNSNKYGNYYTFSQATAGSDSYLYDICPKGWRLPRSSSNKEQYNMINHYISGATWNDGYWSNVTISQITNPPVSLVFSGNWYSGSLSDQGATGYWRSSVPASTNDAYYMFATSDGRVNPRYHFDKSYGFSVRCLVPGV